MIVGVFFDVWYWCIGVIDGFSVMVYFFFVQNFIFMIFFLVCFDGDVEIVFDILCFVVWVFDGDLLVVGLMMVDDYIILMMCGIDVFLGIVMGFVFFVVVFVVFGVYGVFVYLVVQCC